MAEGAIIPVGRIEERILLIRGERVMLDADLAALYGVQTKNLVKAVKRNIERFPEDFMFQLTPAEFRDLRFQFGTSNAGRGGRRYAPYAFTEHGAIMAANVLNNPWFFNSPFVKRGRQGDLLFPLFIERGARGDFQSAICHKPYAISHWLSSI